MNNTILVVTKNFERSKGNVMRFSEEKLKEIFEQIMSEENIIQEAIKKEVTSEDPMEVLFDTYDKEVQKKAIIENRIIDQGEFINTYKSDKKEEFYVFLNDIHIPFHLDEVNNIVNRYGDREYNIVLGGDTMDCFDISVFPKSHSVGLGKEVEIFKALLEKISKKFKKVYILSGNHERRLSTYLRKRVSPEVVALIEDDILENITSQLNLDNVLYVTGDTKNWYMQIDNMIVAHPDTYKKAILGTAVDTFNYFDARNIDADVFVIAHTHHAGICNYKNRILIETGCLCKPQSYAASGQLSYMPQTNSYLIAKSVNNRFEFNNMKLVMV